MSESEDISTINSGAETKNEAEETTTALRMPTQKVNRAQQLKDLVKLDLMKPVASRMRKRYKQILEMSKAKSTKVMKGVQPVWTTVSPEMFISGLRLTTKNGVGTITYHRYEQDADGNKKYVEVREKKRDKSGDMVEDFDKPPISGYYVMECLVVETIEYGKALKVEEIKEFV